MQLVAHGSQDIYLTGNPMITYFKVIYRRHTNFAIENIQQTFNNNPDLGGTVSALISRNGDLISGVHLQCTLPDLSGSASRWVDNVGHFLIKQVEISIGGKIIDTHYGDWLEIWSQLTVPAGQRVGYLEMIGQDQPDNFARLTGLQQDVYDGTIPGRTIYIPLQFWFCRNVGLALPLISLQHHEVIINITFQSLSGLTRGADPTTTGTLTNTSLWVDYIFLDTDERRRFAQGSHEYLIEQLQFNYSNLTCSNNRNSPGDPTYIKLSFNHPVKELIWVVKNLNSEPGNYTSVKAINVIEQSNTGRIGSLGSGGMADISTQSKLLEVIGQDSINPPGALNPVISAQLLLNGNDRFGTQIGEYFNWYHPYKYHTCIPASPGINVYSFGLFPETLQPSGTCNFSRIDTAYLVLRTAVFTNYTGDRVNYPGIHDTQQYYSSPNAVVYVYGTNYNVLRFSSGMCGVAYNN